MMPLNKETKYTRKNTQEKREEAGEGGRRLQRPDACEEVTHGDQSLPHIRCNATVFWLHTFQWQVYSVTFFSKKKSFSFPFFSFVFLVGCSLTALDPVDWGRIKAVVRDTSREFCALIDCSNKEEEETKK